MKGTSATKDEGPFIFRRGELFGSRRGQPAGRGTAINNKVEKRPCASRLSDVPGINRGKPIRRQCPDSEVRKTLWHLLMRTSESKGQYQLCDSGAPFEPEVRNRVCCKVSANFGFGALAVTFKLVDAAGEL
jgi:hypothetical protein